MRVVHPNRLPVTMSEIEIVGDDVVGRLKMAVRRIAQTPYEDNGYSTRNG